MNPHINHPSTGLSTDNPAVTLFTRRTFMKTTALTVGAVALLSQGRALAVEGGHSSSAPLVFGSHVTPGHVHLDDFYGGVAIAVPTPNPATGVRLNLVGYGGKAQGPEDSEMPPLSYTDNIEFDGVRGQRSDGGWYLMAYPGCHVGQVRSAQVGNLPGFPTPGAAVDVVVTVIAISPTPAEEDYVEGDANNTVTVSGTVHLETRAIVPVKSLVKDWSMTFVLK